MPRVARVMSESGFYHVMLRGINRMQLFYDDDDRREFIDRLTRYKDECGLSLIAWCLMGNHVHLLVRVGGIELSHVMKRLELSYSNYYRSKYDWKGYLFQDRYRSEPINDDSYLLAAVRYIHKNPLEAGEPITSWTSHNDYLDKSGITETEMVLGMFSSDAEKARSAFREFIEASDDDSSSFLGQNNKTHISDKDAIEAILSVGGFSVCSDLCLMEKASRNKAIATLRRQGLSIRQISRLTGIGRNIVQSAKP